MGEVGRKKDRVISDHVWARWSTPYKAVVKRGEEREAPALRGDEKAARQIKAAYKAALRTAECKEAMAGQVLTSAAEGRSAVQAGSRWLVQQGRMASAQVLVEAARARSETMHCAYNRWAWALKQVLAGRERGEDVCELSGGLMHPKLGLHTILRRRGIEFMSRLQVWHELEDPLSGGKPVSSLEGRGTIKAPSVRYRSDCLLGPVCSVGEGIRATLTISDLRVEIDSVSPFQISSGVQAST